MIPTPGKGRLPRKIHLFFWTLSKLSPPPSHAVWASFCFSKSVKSISPPQFGGFFVASLPIGKVHLESGFCLWAILVFWEGGANVVDRSGHCLTQRGSVKSYMGNAHTDGTLSKRGIPSVPFIKIRPQQLVVTVHPSFRLSP